MGEMTLGEIQLFAGNFVPANWAPCDGRKLPIAQNQALFSILGVTYGGNGQTDFAVPDLREAEKALVPGTAPDRAAPHYLICTSGLYPQRP